jgi:putative stress-responsive transcriptional regulator
MNEIKKCSISGISFTLDKEAYARLEEYISSLKKAYDHNPDGAEIIADIEARIAELILSALSDAGQTVRKPLIENIIAQLGCAEDISGESADDEPIKSDTRIPRRLYRDVENAKLGGVCAGLGKYFDVDTVWIRLVPFLLLLVLIFCDGWVASIFGNLFGMFVISYIIMWFAVPSAKSARQKLEMNGEPVTVRSISENSSATPEETAKSSVASAVTVLGRIFVVMLKLFVALLILPFIFVSVVLLVAMFAVIFGGFASLFEIGNFGALSGIISPEEPVLCVLGILIALIPIALLLYLFVTLLMNRRPRMWIMLTALLLWIAVIVGTVFAAAWTIDSEDFGDDEVARIMKSNIQEYVLDSDDAAVSGEIDGEEYEKLLYDDDAQSIDR